jgi:hypothetical protein
MRWFGLFGTLLVLFASAGAEEVDSTQLKRAFAGSIVALRQPLRGSEISFESDGKPVPPIQRGTFAHDALFRIDDLRLEGRSLQLICHRVILFARTDSKGIEFFPTDEKARISIVLTSREADSTRRSLDGIFRHPNETSDLLTNYAHAFTHDGTLEPDRPVVRCQLQPIARPAPYGPAGGKMVAKVIVNEHGEPEAIGVISSPKSKGDTKIFVETLWNWRFAPYLKEGKPTACTATIGMKFEPPRPHARLR